MTWRCLPGGRGQDGIHCLMGLGLAPDLTRVAVSCERLAVATDRPSDEGNFLQLEPFIPEKGAQALCKRLKFLTAAFRHRACGTDGREHEPSAAGGQPGGHLLFTVAAHLGLVSAVSPSQCHPWTPAQASSERGVSACGGVKHQHGLCPRQADLYIWTTGRSLGVGSWAWASSPHCFHTLLFNYSLRCFVTLAFGTFFSPFPITHLAVSLLCPLYLQSPLAP